MDFGRETELALGSDPLTPYVLLAVERAEQIAGSTSTDLGHAVHRHFNLIRQHNPYVLERDFRSLHSWAQRLVQTKLSTRDPLARYLSVRRLELSKMLSDEHAPTSLLATRTWTDVRTDAALSSAFDNHMIARSTPDLGIPPLLHCAPLVVDIGGGPGHYSAAIMRRLSMSWKCIILENYEQAGWYAQVRIPRPQLHVKITPSWPTVPSDAGLYLLANIVHNLDDTTALHVLRSCARAATSTSQILLIERRWDSSSLSDSSRDLDMRILFGGKERTDKELLSLFESSGLQMTNRYDTADNYRIMIVRRAS
jgi:hypothetical protein